MRKLDDRSRALVHLDTEPGSKVYRMFDPVSRRIIISRDVGFDESKRWKWSDLQEDIVEKPGMFSVTLGGYRNQGIEDNIINKEETDTSEDSNQNHDAETPDEDAPEEEIQLRRSTRITKKPTYLEDYI